MSRFVWLLVAGLPVAACQSGAPEPADAAPKQNSATLHSLARVNGLPVAREEFMRYAAPYPEHLKKDVAGLQRVLDSFVDNLLLEQEAHRRGLDKDPQYLAKVENYRRNLLLNRLLEQQGAGALEVSEEDARRYFEEHPQEFDQPERVHLRHLLVDDEQLARKLRQRLDQGESFVKLVGEYSLDRASRSRGGDLGVFSREQRPELAAAAFKLREPGQLAGPVKTSRGYHLLQLIRRLPARQQDFASAKQSLLARLRAVRRQEVKMKLLEQLRSQARIEVNREALAKLAGQAGG